MTVGEFKKWLEENDVSDDHELYLWDDNALFFERELYSPYVSTVKLGILNPVPTVQPVVMFT